ncbi:23858_t:CDS:2, partial [Gigaspora margarita]
LAKETTLPPVMNPVKEPIRKLTSLMEELVVFLKNDNNRSRGNQNRNWNNLLFWAIDNRSYALKNTPREGGSASRNKILSLDTLFEVYVAKKRKKDNGEVEEIETLEERKKAAKDLVHKKKKVIAKKRKTKPVEPLITSNIQPYSTMMDLQNKKANITYTQLFQVAPNIGKEMNKITRAGRITTTKVAEFCLKQDKEEKTTSMYCEAQVKEKEESKGELDMSEEETVTENNENDSSREYEDEKLVDQSYLYWEFQKNEGEFAWCGKCLKKGYNLDVCIFFKGHEYETIYLNEKKKEEGFKLECMTEKQETRLRAILTKYKSAFKKESGQLGRTSITQHEIYMEDEKACIV